MDEAQSGLLDAFLSSAEEADNEFIENGGENEGAMEAREAPEQDAVSEEDETEQAEATEESDAESETEDDGDYVEFETDDGETERVSLSELLDARKQLNELGSNSSQIRQQIAEQASQQIQQRVQQLDAAMQETYKAYELVSQLMPNVQEPPDDLIYQDPDTYYAQKQAVQQVRKIMEDAQGTVQRLQEQRQKAAIEHQKADAEKEWSLLVNADPTWTKGNPEQRLNALRTGVSEAFGIPMEAVQGIYHHGFIRMAEAALKAAKSEGKGIQPKKKAAPRLVKAGSKRAAPQTQNTQRQAKARQQLKKTGQVSDLEAVWGQFL